MTHHTTPELPPEIEKRFDLRYRLEDDWDNRLFKLTPQGYVSANDDIKQFLAQELSTLSHTHEAEMKEAVEAERKRIVNQALASDIWVTSIETGKPLHFIDLESLTDQERNYQND